MKIHKTAIIEDGAQIDESAEIGAYAMVGSNVQIGPGTKLGAHTIVSGHTKIGANCNIFPGAIIGLEPQDLKYNNEPTGVIMGDNCTVREYVTIHRATGDRMTIIGNDCFLMNYVHIAHDCRLGNGVIIANNTTFAGHVHVGDNSVLSGSCIFHQFVRIGRGVMIGGMSGSRVDVPPFTMCDGRPTAVHGVNVIGLRRQKASADIRESIKQTYKLIYRSGLNTSQAIARIESEIQPCDQVKEIVEFFRSSKRGVAQAAAQTREDGALDNQPADDI